MPSRPGTGRDRADPEEDDDMPDLGHDLLLGAFVTPVNDPPHRAVELALAAEAAGLDAVAVQDHPYQPRFHDTWTLLAWVAARTERVRLVPDVANLPLRPPAVLARAVAGLDLLSGGRVELGLGAGAFWDAIEAMGGPRLSPGEAVTALEEAVAVVRGVWDVSTRERLVVPGRFHRLDGAKRGPAPAHDVGIWLGAYGPRMLRLTGCVADGWLPSLGYLDPAGLARACAAVDAAAREAGRDPGDVRRVLNVEGRLAERDGGFLVGPPRQWAEQLAELALELGFSVFLLPGDDERDLAVFGAEVAPAVREIVAAERLR